MCHGELHTKQVYAGRYSRNRALRFGCAYTVPLRKQACQKDLSNLKRLAHSLAIVQNTSFLSFLTIFPALPIDAARSIVCTNQIMMDVRCVMACGDCGCHSGSMVIIWEISTGMYIAHEPHACERCVHRVNTTGTIRTSLV